MYKKAKNYRHHVAPESDFTELQLNKVADSVKIALKDFNINPKKGTFILEYQSYGGLEPQWYYLHPTTQRIVEFEFEGGVQKNFICQGRDSREMAEELIAYIATCSNNSGSAIRYNSGTPYYMQLEADDGRFNAVYFADNGNFKDQFAVYCALAKALSMIMPGDLTLQKSWQTTREFEASDFLGIKAIDETIETFYKKAS